MPAGLVDDPGFTFAHLTGTYSDPQYWRLLAITLQCAIGSTALALLLGGTLHGARVRPFE